MSVRMRERGRAGAAVRGRVVGVGDVGVGDVGVGDAVSRAARHAWLRTLVLLAVLGAVPQW